MIYECFSWGGCVLRLWMTVDVTEDLYFWYEVDFVSNWGGGLIYETTALYTLHAS